MTDAANPTPGAETPAAETPAAETPKAWANPYARKAAPVSPETPAVEVAAAPVQPPAPKAPPPAAKAPAKAPPAPAAPPVDPKYAALESTVKAQREALAGFASQALADVPEPVRAAVKALAGNDPTKQLSALATLKANGLVSGSLPVGATTGAATPPPSPAPKAASTDAALLAQYQSFVAAGAPSIAQSFLARNRDAIERAAKASN